MKNAKGRVRVANRGEIKGPTNGEIRNDTVRSMSWIEVNEPPSGKTVDG